MSVSESGRKAHQSLSTSVYVTYGTGSLGTGLFSALPGLLLLYFMTDTLGVPAGLAGMAVFLPKIWDVITDPIMGVVSDRTTTRWGRRRPFLLAGAVALPIFLGLLFNVPVFDSPMTTFIYVTIIFALSATAYTLFQVPYIAMPAEMTSDYHERTTIMGYRMAFMTIGILVAGGAAPMIIDLAGGGRGGYAVMSAVLAVICMAAMLISFFGTAGTPFTSRVESAAPWREQMRIAFSNRPFVRLMAGFFPQQIGVGAVLAALPFYVVYILGRDNAVVTFMFLSLIVPAIVTMPFWVWVSKRIGKRNAYLICSTLFGLMALSLMIGSGERLWLLYLQVVVMGAGYAGIQLFPFSMLPDAIHLDHARSGLRREGIFTGVWTAQEKTGMALGALVTGKILDWAGFIESGAGQTVAQPDSALTGILIAMAIAPAVTMALSLPILKRYDLTADRLERLEAEEA